MGRGCHLDGSLAPVRVVLVLAVLSAGDRDLWSEVSAISFELRLNLWYNRNVDRNAAPLQPSSPSQFTKEGSVKDWQPTPIRGVILVGGRLFCWLGELWT